jgi:hypothetical protein
MNCPKMCLTNLHTSSKVAIVVALIAAAHFLTGSAAACSCPPPQPGTQPALRVPSLDGDSAVFVGVVEEVYPKDLPAYKAHWRQMYHEDLSEDRPPSVEQLRSFLLQIWAKIYSPAEKEKMDKAKSIDDLESAVEPFWLTPRRIRLRISEPFAGPKSGRLVLYTGIGGGDCGVDLKVGEQWLVDADRDEAGRWIAHFCSVTIPVSEAGDVLHVLRIRTKR